MGSPSKEESVAELFFNEPSKHWHFHEMVRTAQVSEAAASKWLKKLRSEGVIRHVKPRGKMPYFQAALNHPSYDHRKRIYALQKLHKTGLLTRLLQLKKAQAIILFGSWYRGDWNSTSDVDVFVLGDAGRLRFGMPWPGLGFQGRARQVEVHSFRSRAALKDIRSGLLKNVAQGYFIKGSIHDIAEVAL